MSNYQSAALICRVSTKEQEEGYSLEAQERLLREHCERKEFDIKFTWAFSESASKYEQRKKFREFIGEVKRQKVFHIIVEKVDRLSRSGSRDASQIDDWLEEDANRHVHCVKQSLDVHKHAPASVKFVWDMHMAVAKHASNNISEEVTKTTLVMLKKGIWPNDAKVGYIRDRSNLASPIQIHPQTSLIVKRLFKMYATGEYSILRLHKLFRAEGVTDNKGRIFRANRIHVILQDPFYVGIMKYGGKEWLGAHEPIISQDLYQRVQNRLKGKSTHQKVFHYQKHNHLLRGFVTCAHCHRSLTWEIQKGRTYGYCRLNQACQIKTRKKEDEAEAMILGTLQSLEVKSSKLSAVIYKLLNVEENGGRSNNVVEKVRLADTLEATKAKLSRLLDLHLEGRVSLGEYEQKRVDLRSQEVRLQSVIANIENDHEKTVTSPSKVFDMAQHLASYYRESTTEQKRKVIGAVFESIQVAKKEMTITLRQPFASLANAVAITNCSKSLDSGPPANSKFELVEIASDKQKDQPFNASHLVWRAEWDEFRKLDYENALLTELLCNE